SLHVSLPISSPVPLRQGSAPTCGGMSDGSGPSKSFPKDSSHYARQTALVVRGIFSPLWSDPRGVGSIPGDGFVQVQNGPSHARRGGQFNTIEFVRHGRQSDRQQVIGRRTNGSGLRRNL